MRCPDSGNSGPSSGSSLRIRSTTKWLLNTLSRKNQMVSAVTGSAGSEPEPWNKSDIEGVNNKRSWRQIEYRHGAFICQPASCQLSPLQTDIVFLSCHLITLQVTCPHRLLVCELVESKNFVVHIFIPYFAMHCLLYSGCLMYKKNKGRKEQKVSALHPKESYNENFCSSPNYLKPW